MNGKLIYGIQQVGVGVSNATEAFEWYATRLGADVVIFDDNNTATHMAPYMGGEARNKRALLAINLQGGSGYEIWQYLDRKPEGPKQPIMTGDLGINMVTVKSLDVQKTYDRLKAKGVKLLSEVVANPDGQPTFYMEDPYGNILQIKEFHSWFSRKRTDVGGIFGCTIGVSDIDKALTLYSDILGFTEVIYDETGTFDDLAGLPGGKERMRRVLLGKKDKSSGGFSELFGENQLELIQLLDATPKSIFADRYWGDLGFIHLCFDIKNMKALVNECAAKGLPFKVLSEPDFDMGDTNAHWGYIEDPDGTLIEFVETHKVPVLKKFNLFIDLKGRDPKKNLPNWLIRALSFNRKKF